MTATKTRPSSTTKKVAKSVDKTKKPSWGVVSFKKIEEWRTKLGLSKSGMAEALGVTNSTFHNWRRGTTVPHSNQQDDIALRLDALERNAGVAPLALITGGLHDAKTSNAANPKPAKSKSAKSKPVKTAAAKTAGRPSKSSCHQGIATPGTLPSQAKVHRNDIATITAAWITSQQKAVSAGSVMEFVQSLQAVM